MYNKRKGKNKESTLYKKKITNIYEIVKDISMYKTWKKNKWKVQVPVESFNGFLLSSGDASKCVADNLCACNPLLWEMMVYFLSVFFFFVIQSSLNKSDLDEEKIHIWREKKKEKKNKKI